MGRETIQTIKVKPDQITLILPQKEEKESACNELGAQFQGTAEQAKTMIERLMLKPVAGRIIS